MAEVTDLAAERVRCEVDRAWAGKYALRVPEEVPGGEAAGYTVVVLDSEGQEALRFPCAGGGDGTPVLGVLPGEAERAVVRAALQEALADL